MENGVVVMFPAMSHRLVLFRIHGFKDTREVPNGDEIGWKSSEIAKYETVGEKLVTL